MSHREAQIDAMLRYLGAAYYQTIRGEAMSSDVARALESAEAADESVGVGSHHSRPKVPHGGDGWPWAGPVTAGDCRK